MVAVMCSLHFLKRHFIEFILLYICFLTYHTPCYSINNGIIKCELLKTCQCVCPDGYGVDLSKDQQWYSFTNYNKTFYFHPCSLPIETSENCPSGALVCLLNHSTKSYTNLGFENETAVSIGPGKAIQLKYNHGDIVTTIQLNCSNGESSASLSAVPSQEVNHYELVLTTPSACTHRVVYDEVEADSPDTSSHLSTGSLLVILFLVFSSLYFMGGALALKLLRGAEGKEMIPNYEFWVGLPGLVREGFLFAINGCKTPQAYDRI